jgi:hypothetical protein
MKQAIKLHGLLGVAFSRKGFCPATHPCQGGAGVQPCDRPSSTQPQSSLGSLQATHSSVCCFPSLEASSQAYRSQPHQMGSPQTSYSFVKGSLRVNRSSTCCRCAGQRCTRRLEQSANAPPSSSTVSKQNKQPTDRRCPCCNTCEQAVEASVTSAGSSGRTLLKRARNFY